MIFSYAGDRERVGSSGAAAEMVTARSMLVYLGREWGRASVKEDGKRLHRDPSVISRLYSAYAAARDEKKEAVLLRQLKP